MFPCSDWRYVRARDSQSWVQCLFYYIQTSVLSLFLCCYWCFVPKGDKGIPHAHLIWEKWFPNCTLFWQNLTPQYHTIINFLKGSWLVESDPDFIPLEFLRVTRRMVSLRFAIAGYFAGTCWELKVCFPCSYTRYSYEYLKGIWVHMRCVSGDSLYCQRTDNYS
jgi:hypothetical protein